MRAFRAGAGKIGAYDECSFFSPGEGTFFGTSGERVVGGGEIVIVPAGEPHGFTNTGEGPLRQIDIHVNPTFETEWLKG